MKKILILIMSFIGLSLIGCSNNKDFDIPTSNITIEKNHQDISTDPPSNMTAYNLIILEGHDDKLQFINNLNKITYVVEKNISYDMEYRYQIVFDDTIISLADDNCFYLNGKFYRITSGDLLFLDDYDWQPIEEE